MQKYEIKSIHIGIILANYNEILENYFFEILFFADFIYLCRHFL